MKSLIRWSATLGLLGSVVLGSIVGSAAKVLALTNDQILARLRPVPVFTLTDAQGAPLVASPTQGEEGAPVAGVFVSRQDAETFLNNLRSNNPDLARTVQIVPVSLAEVYELAQQAQNARNAEEQLRFHIVPMQQQVQSATTLLQRSGQNVQQFQGVPLFIARSTSQDGGYLTIQQGGEQVIPMFFKQEELQQMLDRLRAEQPDLASSMTIQVINLEGLLETLETSDNQELNRIVLVPPRESVEFIRSIQQQQGGNPQRPGQQPGQQPQQRPGQQPQQRPAQPR